MNKPLILAVFAQPDTIFGFKSRRARWQRRGTAPGGNERSQNRRRPRHRHEGVLRVRTGSVLGWDGDRHGKEKEDASIAAKKHHTGLVAFMFMLVAAGGPLEAQGATVETQRVDAMNKLYGVHRGFRANHATSAIEHNPRPAGSRFAIKIMGKLKSFERDAIPSKRTALASRAAWERRSTNVPGAKHRPRQSRLT